MQLRESEMRPTPRLLIVGDDATRKLWRIVFASRGWMVESAATEAEALDRLDSAPDYVILGVGGGEVVRRIRERNLKSRVAFVADPDEDEGPGRARPTLSARRTRDVVEVWREGVLAAVG